MITALQSFQIIHKEVSKADTPDADYLLDAIDYGLLDRARQASENQINYELSDEI